MHITQKEQLINNLLEKRNISDRLFRLYKQSNIMLGSDHEHTNKILDSYVASTIADIKLLNKTSNELNTSSEKLLKIICELEMTIISCRNIKEKLAQL